MQNTNTNTNENTTYEGVTLRALLSHMIADIENGKAVNIEDLKKAYELNNQREGVK